MADKEAVASGYCRMKMMGVLDDAVWHKMTQDEVSAKIIAAVMGNPLSKPDAPKTAAVAPCSSISSGCSHSSTSFSPHLLSDKEEAIVNGYCKMKKIGLLEDAIQHKMSQDGVDAKIIAVVMGEALTSFSSSSFHFFTFHSSSFHSCTPGSSCHYIVGF